MTKERIQAILDELEEGKIESPAAPICYGHTAAWSWRCGWDAGYEAALTKLLEEENHAGTTQSTNSP